MGGKSRKSGGVSKRLIDILKNQSPNTGTKKPQRPGLFDGTVPKTSGSNEKKRK